MIKYTKIEYIHAKLFITEKTNRREFDSDLRMT